jgi:hypothetical protein
VTYPYGRNLKFVDRNRYFFFQVDPQLYSQGRMDPVPDSLLLRKSGSDGNRTRTSGYNNNNNNSVPLVHERTIPTGDLPLSSKLVPTFADRMVFRGQRGRSPYGRNLTYFLQNLYEFR